MICRVHFFVLAKQIVSYVLFTLTSKPVNVQLYHVGKACKTAGDYTSMIHNDIKTLHFRVVPPDCVGIVFGRPHTVWHTRPSRSFWARDCRTRDLGSTLAK